MINTECKLVVARGWWEGKTRRNCLIGKEMYLEGMEMFWD